MGVLGCSKESISDIYIPPDPLLLWLDSSDMSTLYQDVAGTTQSTLNLL
jgi:hypothetical protein